MFVRYDSRLGWTLSPGWTGQHRHFDFAARYAINDFGFRADGGFGSGPGTRYAVVGDSFAFGLGVNDEETFVNRLNRAKSLNASFWNFSVPGYSPDQELLLVEQSVFKFKPDAVLLMVYLGNDLFDILYPFPLQGNLAKPRFQLTADGLRLEEEPPAGVQKPASLAGLELADVVLGSREGASGWMTRLGRRSQLVQLAGDTFRGNGQLGADFSTRLQPAYELFTALVERMQRACAKQGVKLILGIMAGQSFVRDPDSISGQYQERCRAAVLAVARNQKLDTIDFAQKMQQRYRLEKGKWFFPHDGHLTALGHQVVAEILEAYLLKPSPRPPQLRLLQ